MQMQLFHRLLSRHIRRAWMYPDPCPMELSQLACGDQGYVVEMEGNLFLIVGSPGFRTINSTIIEGHDGRRLITNHGSPLPLAPSVLNAPISCVWTTPGIQDADPALLALESSSGAVLAFSWYVDFEASLLTPSCLPPEPQSVSEALLSGNTDLALRLQRMAPDFPTDEGKRTALHVAAATGNSLFLRSLSPPVENLNAEDDQEHTAFQQACMMGHVACAKILFNLGARVPDETNSIAALLTTVCVNETFTTLRYLVRTFGPLDKDTAERALTMSCLSDASCCTGFLLREIRQGLSQEEFEKFLHTSRALEAAVTSNAITSAKLLINHGFSPRSCSCDDGSLLHLAVEADSRDMVELLLHEGADPEKRNCDGKRPLDIAIRDGQTRLATILRASMNEEETLESDERAAPLWRKDRFTVYRRAYERRLYNIWYALDEDGLIVGVLLDFDLFTLSIDENRTSDGVRFRFSFDRTCNHRDTDTPSLLRASSFPPWRQAMGNPLWAIWIAASESRCGELMALSFASTTDLGVCLRTQGKGIEVLRSTFIADCNDPPASSNSR